MYGLVRALYRSISRTTERNTELVRNARKLRLKFRDIRQTVADTEKVQKFAKENKKDELAAKIERTANYDREFRTFINDFNKKHKTKITVLDVSNYAREYKSLSKPGLKPDDLKILDEFRKRRLEMKARQVMVMADEDQTLASSEQDDFGSSFKETDDMSMGKSEKSSNEVDSSEQESGERRRDRDNQELAGQKEEAGDEEGDIIDELIEEENTQEGIQSQMNDDQALRQGPLQINDEFYACIIDQDSTTLVTTLNRVNSFRCLVFMANAGGVIAYGRGKGADHGIAMQKAFMHCQQNMIAIPLDPNLTVPQKLQQRFLDYELIIKPRTFFNSWGHPAVAAILSLCGLNHCSFKTVHTDSNNYGLLNAVFKCVTKNKTPQQISERQGFKIYRHQWVKPLERPQGRTSFRK